MKMHFPLLALTLMTACTPKETPLAEPLAETASSPAASVALPKTLQEAVASDTYRTPDNRLRDSHRHPVETLEFFGIKPEMTVVEISPSAGWYTEILAPYLSAQGQYIAAAPSPGDNPYMKKSTDKFAEWLGQHPEIKVTASPFDLPTGAEIAPPGTADLVLTFRNVHNWMAQGTQKAAFAAFYKALKPGGVLGVVEHREKAKKKQDPLAKSGYVKESEVIRLAEKAGFKLDAKSEINANPKDTKNYAKGVWTLPPVLTLKDQDQAKYVAIGESDRMTLRFVKPAQ